MFSGEAEEMISDFMKDTLKPKPQGDQLKQKQKFQLKLIKGGATEKGDA